MRAVPSLVRLGQRGCFSRIENSSNDKKSTSLEIETIVKSKCFMLSFSLKSFGISKVKIDFEMKLTNLQNGILIVRLLRYDSVFLYDIKTF